ncbi:MAG: hypothetical protein KGL26_01080 [Pseudomonadota bacterium]|nr:hypothetical protein [Pseudomonadota bacterium]
MTEQFHMVVCARTPDIVDRFTDNLYGCCAFCGHKIYFRPATRPYEPKICLPCAHIEMEMLHDIGMAIDRLDDDGAPIAG